MIEQLNMGGYALYVWSSLGLTLFVIFICVMQSKSAYKNAIINTRRRLKSMESEN